MSLGTLHKLTAPPGAIKKQKVYKMTSNELLEIHLNNSDLNLLNLSQIHKSSISAVRSILEVYYKDKDWSPIHLLEPKAL
jgi:hypothetical protein